MGKTGNQIRKAVGVSKGLRMGDGGSKTKKTGDEIRAENIILGK